MNKRITRTLGATATVLLIAGMLATSGLAQAGYSEASLLERKDAANNTLVLEAGQRLALRANAVITMDGRRISFAEILTPQQALPGVVMVQWAPNSDGSTSTVLIRHMLE